MRDNVQTATTQIRLGGHLLTTHSPQVTVVPTITARPAIQEETHRVGPALAAIHSKKWMRNIRMKTAITAATVHSAMQTAVSMMISEPGFNLPQILEVAMTYISENEADRDGGDEAAHQDSVNFALWLGQPGAAG